MYIKICILYIYQAPHKTIKFRSERKESFMFVSRLLKNLTTVISGSV